jgi:hypothetical protein
MRWMSLAKKDGSKDMYCVGFVTHTVAKVVLNSRVTFEAWRLGKQSIESVSLGNFTGEDAFSEAKLAVENDVRSLSSSGHSAHGTATREASQGRSSSSEKSSVTAEVHAASFAPDAVEVQP